MELELERERRVDAREGRLFDQFRDYLDTTRSDLKDAALVREKNARLELLLQHTEEKAAAAAAAAATVAAAGKSRVAHDVIQRKFGTSAQSVQPIRSDHVITALSGALPAVSCVSAVNVPRDYFSNKNNFLTTNTASNAMSVQSENSDVEFVDPHHVTRVPLLKIFLHRSMTGDLMFILAKFQNPRAKHKILGNFQNLIPHQPV